MRMCVRARRTEERGAGVKKREREKEVDGAIRGTALTRERGKRVAAAGSRVPVGPPHL